MSKLISAAIGALIVCLIAACGGGSVGSDSSGSSGGSGNVGGACTANSSVNNVQPVCVSSGPNNNYVNGLFTSVTICTPGTSACQTINNVLVDTGSYGLRLLRTLVTTALPVQTNAVGNQIGECTRFADGYSWGPVVTADVRLANETAGSVPIQLIGPTNFFAVPSDCSEVGEQEEDDINSLDVNGILGVGVFAQDCGPRCASPDLASGIAQYFACSSTTTPTCIATPEALASQVTNPVALFATDNNGIQIQLPQIDASGANTVSGLMILGIGTQSNNGRSSSVAVLDTDGNGDVATSYDGNSYSSFIDSGSNAVFFSASIAACTDPKNPDAGDFYCPTSTLSESAQITGFDNTTGKFDGVSKTVSFAVANALSLFNSNNIAFNDLAGGTGSGELSGSFDFGLPFFFGKDVYFGLYNEAATGSPEPYVAY